MRAIKPRYPLYLRYSKKKGWGVFCAKKIPKGRVFEVCPVILLPRKQLKRFNNTPIESYRFSFWGDTTAIVLGFGSLYNHSEKNANCEYNVNRKSRTYSFYSIKEIPAHQELLHNYNWDDSDYKSRNMAKE